MACHVWADSRSPAVSTSSACLRSIDMLASPWRPTYSQATSSMKSSSTRPSSSIADHLSGPQSTAISLFPPILEHDIGEIDTADRSEPAHRIPDRQDRIGVPISRQSESGFDFPLEIQVQGCQGR